MIQRLLIAALILMFTICNVAFAAAVPTKLLVVMLKDYAPSAFEENQQLKGISHDVTGEAFRRIGLDCEFKGYSFAEMLELGKTGQADVLLDVQYKVSRTDWFYYPDEAISNVKICLYALAGKHVTYDGSIDSLKGARIATIQKYSYGSAFDTAVKDNLIVVDPSDNAAVCYNKLLNDNRVDYLVEYSGAFVNNIKNLQINPARIIELQPPLVNSVKEFTVFSKKSPTVTPELVTAFNKAVVAMKADGTFQRIVDSYVSYSR